MISYEDARKMAENQKYGATGNSDNIDESYIKSLQNNDVQSYMNKIVSNTKVNSNTSSGGGGGGGYKNNYTPLSTQQAYQQASDIVNPQMQQLKNNLILQLQKQRGNDVTSLAQRGQATGGQRQLAEANVSSEEALQGSNILLQGDVAKNQLAEQYMATSKAEADRQNDLQYRQYMDGMNIQRQNRVDDLSENQFNETIRQNNLGQENYLAEFEYQKAQDDIQNAMDEGQLSISQGQLALSEAKFTYEKATANSGNRSTSTTNNGMTDQQMKLEAIKRATDSSGNFDQDIYNQIYRLLGGNVPTSPTYLRPIQKTLLNSIYSLGGNETIPTSTNTSTSNPTENDIYNKYVNGQISQDEYYTQLDKYGY